jgi:N-acetylglutamate synthase-like GNAT family acetyltransferase
MLSDHITKMGFRLEFADDVRTVQPLIEASALEPFADDAEDGWGPSRYLLACTRAGGVAACVGWTQHTSGHVVIHSLAVAQPSRGSGIGGGLLATAMGQLVETGKVLGFWLTTTSGNARHLFWSLGFTNVEDTEVPEFVADHPIMLAQPDGTRMARIYGEDHLSRSLDRTAFRLIQNDTHEATLPLGSVFYFRQTGLVVEASYRGGEVTRGHLLGHIQNSAIPFCWHQFVQLPDETSSRTSGRLMSGDGRIVLELMADGRRELRERFEGSGELLLREV